MISKFKEHIVTRLGHIFGIEDVIESMINKINAEDIDISSKTTQKDTFNKILKEFGITSNTQPYWLIYLFLIDHTAPGAIAPSVIDHYQEVDRDLFKCGASNLDKHIPYLVTILEREGLLIIKDPKHKMTFSKLVHYYNMEMLNGDINVTKKLQAISKQVGSAKCLLYTLLATLYVVPIMVAHKSILLSQVTSISRK